MAVHYLFRDFGTGRCMAAQPPPEPHFVDRHGELDVQAAHLLKGVQLHTFGPATRTFMPSNRRHWHLMLPSKDGRLWFRASVRLTKREREHDLPTGSRRVVRRWFTSRSGAARLRDRLDRPGHVVECRDPACKDAPPL